MKLYVKIQESCSVTAVSSDDFEQGSFVLNSNNFQSLVYIKP